MTGAARYVGARVPRVEDHRLLTGRGTYVADVFRPGMLHCAFVRSPLARATIGAIDTTEALSLPGVVAVHLAADLAAHAHPIRYAGEDPTSAAVPPLLAADEVRFVGDPVALVVAEDRYVAEDAAGLVGVEYEPLAPVVGLTEALTAENIVHPVRADNSGNSGNSNNIALRVTPRPLEDVDEAFAGAAHVVRATIHEHAHAPVPLETRGLVAQWSAGELTVWASSQAAHEARSVAAQLLGLPEHQVRVIVRDTGGGFGLKVAPVREELCVLVAARRSPAALSWIEDRTENLTAGGQARHERGEVALGFTADHTLACATLRHVQDNGAYPTSGSVRTGPAAGMMFPGPYRLPLSRFEHTSVFTNTAGRVAYRGPWAFETLARETTLDIAARRMGVDPVELRRRNLLRLDELPVTNAHGMPYSHMTPAETYEKALEILNVEEFRRMQAAARLQGRHLGMGTSTYCEPTSPGVGHHGSEGAVLRIDPSGTVTVLVAGGSAGNSLETAAVQLTADALGMRIEDVRTIQGDTALTPFGAGTGGSRSGSMLAGAIGTTAAALRARLLAVAAHVLEASVDDLDLADSRVSVRGAPGVALSVAEIAEIAHHHPERLPAGLSPGLEESGRYRAESPVIWSNAAHVCTCEVDVRTGQVTLLRYIVAEDCGKVVNPAVVEGQIAGGVVQGIGGVLLEHLAYDADGTPRATTFMDYLLPTTTDVSMIEYGHVESPAPGPGGIKGVGEGGAIGAPPAVVNAVADALAPFGAEITRLPLTPEAVLDLVETGERVATP